MAAGVERIDWRAPWFEPWREVGGRVAARWQAGCDLPGALNLEQGAPVRFAPPAELVAGASYEAHVFANQACPTRDNLHDFFNGLAWIQFPQAKSRLNALQAAQIAQVGKGSARGPVRDAITILDENGALLDAPEPLWQALLARDWRGLFVDRRALWAQARLIVFGHALLDKLVQPRKEITAHVWRAPCPRGPTAEVDGWLAGQLTPEQLAAKPFTPLPVLGIPGWCPENQNDSFYDDALVFRPAGRPGRKNSGFAAVFGP